MTPINATSCCSRPLLISKTVQLIVSHGRRFLFCKFALWAGQMFMLKFYQSLRNRFEAFPDLRKIFRGRNQQMIVYLLPIQVFI